MGEEGGGDVGFGSGVELASETSVVGSLERLRVELGGKVAVRGAGVVSEAAADA